MSRLILTVSALWAKLQKLEDKFAAERRVTMNVAGGIMKAARKDAGMSLRKLAEAMGISAPFLQDMEEGNRAYTMGHVTNAFKALGQVTQEKGGAK